MSKKTTNIKFLSVKVGEYEKDGEKKGKYFSFGKILEFDDGTESIMLEPVVQNLLKLLFGGKFEGWVNVFQKSDENEGSGNKKAQQDEYEDDLPF